MHGWLNINKEPNMTSFDVIREVRKKFKIKKVGHAGTLDPFATGVLPIAIGNATKLIEYLVAKDKTYVFTVEFGKTTDTLDIDGKITDSIEKVPTHEECRSVINNFLGVLTQIPPKYSAIKINGQRAYNLARNNQEFEIKPRNVFIHSLELLDFDEEKSHATYRVKCSKGTYIRSLARDIAESMQTLGFVIRLIREEVGSFLIGNSIKLNELSSDKVLSIEDVLDDIPVVDIDRANASKVSNGQNVKIFGDDESYDLVFIKNNNELISIGSSQNGFYKPLKNFNNY
jgi:tRNA pseudouridine55 synthase